MTETTKVLKMLSAICMQVAVALALAAVLGFAAPPAAQAQTFSVLYSFGATSTDGKDPKGKLVLDAAGNLYGTTANGGTGTACFDGCGTIFKIDPSGNETVLYNFTGGADGYNPLGGVIRDPEGNLYGTASVSGNSCSCGTVFKLDSSNNFTVLHTFTGPDGDNPEAGLVSLNGELYGTTASGGNGLGCCGVIFKISKGGAFHVLHVFAQSEGQLPQGIVTDTAGNIYGATKYGGASGDGTIFELDTAGNLTDLFSFSPDAGGVGPVGRIIRDVNGNIHGVTGVSGSAIKAVVFRISSTGSESVLHTFGTATEDGTTPAAGVVDASGVLYGTTFDGGIPDGCNGAGCGVVYRIAGNGKYTVLYRFTGAADSGGPGELTLDGSGNLYGVATTDLVGDNGVVFKITP
jgi:uncharacterized repeat protein (TIGR03803 family)